MAGHIIKEEEEEIGIINLMIPVLKLLRFVSSFMYSSI